MPTVGELNVKLTAPVGDINRSLADVKSGLQGVADTAKSAGQSIQQSLASGSGGGRSLAEFDTTLKSVVDSFRGIGQLGGAGSLITGIAQIGADISAAQTAAFRYNRELLTASNAGSSAALGVFDTPGISARRAFAGRNTAEQDAMEALAEEQVSSRTSIVGGLIEDAGKYAEAHNLDAGLPFGVAGPLRRLGASFSDTSAVKAANLAKQKRQAAQNLLQPLQDKLSAIEDKETLTSGPYEQALLLEATASYSPIRRIEAQANANKARLMRQAARLLARSKGPGDAYDLAAQAYKRQALAEEAGGTNQVKDIGLATAQDLERSFTSVTNKRDVIEAAFAPGATNTDILEAKRRSVGRDANDFERQTNEFIAERGNRLAPDEITALKTKIELKKQEAALDDRALQTQERILESTVKINQLVSNASIAAQQESAAPLSAVSFASDAAFTNFATDPNMYLGAIAARLGGK